MQVNVAESCFPLSHRTTLAFDRPNCFAMVMMFGRFVATFDFALDVIRPFSLNRFRNRFRNYSPDSRRLSTRSTDWIMFAGFTSEALTSGSVTRTWVRFPIHPRQFWQWRLQNSHLAQNARNS